MKVSVNVNAWKSKTKQQKDKIKSKATDYVRAKALQVLKSALNASPQWSGNFAYNWTLATSSTESGDRYQTRFKVDPYWELRGKQKKMGDQEAIAEAMQYNKNYVVPLIKWNSNVKLINLHPKAELIASGDYTPDRGRRRPENLIPGGASIGAYLQAKYRFIT